MARNPQRRQAKAIRRKRLLAERRRLGAAGAKGSLERPHSEGEDADVEGAYDPAVAPDPAHWLARISHAGGQLDVGFGAI
jgi:hypothetical protein